MKMFSKDEFSNVVKHVSLVIYSHWCLQYNSLNWKCFSSNLNIISPFRFPFNLSFFLSFISFVTVSLSRWDNEKGTKGFCMQDWAKRHFLKFIETEILVRVCLGALSHQKITISVWHLPTSTMQQINNAFFVLLTYFLICANIIWCFVQIYFHNIENQLFSLNYRIINSTKLLKEKILYLRYC